MTISGLSVYALNQFFAEMHVYMPECVDAFRRGCRDGSAYDAAVLPSGHAYAVPKDEWSLKMLDAVKRAQRATFGNCGQGLN